jgi:hypothetical protein
MMISCAARSSTESAKDSEWRVPCGRMGRSVALEEFPGMLDEQRHAQRRAVITRRRPPLLILVRTSVMPSSALASLTAPVQPLGGTSSQQIRAVIGWWAGPRMCVAPGCGCVVDDYLYLWRSLDSRHASRRDRRVRIVYRDVPGEYHGTLVFGVGARDEGIDHIGLSRFVIEMVVDAVSADAGFRSGLLDTMIIASGGKDEGQPGQQDIALSEARAQAGGEADQ